jgi:hypothetical protein
MIRLLFSEALSPGTAGSLAVSSHDGLDGCTPAFSTTEAAAVNETLLFQCGFEPDARGIKITERSPGAPYRPIVFAAGRDFSPELFRDLEAPPIKARFESLPAMPMPDCGP